MFRWLVENLIAEIVFGVLLLPFIVWFGKYIHRRIKARKIVKILSIHNDPTRTWRKGIYARDRFMELYEAGVPLDSTSTLLHGGGDNGAAWWTEYLDKGILQKYGLVTIFEKGGRKKVKINKNKLSELVYKRVKKLEDTEVKKTKTITEDKGTLRNVPNQ